MRLFSKDKEIKKDSQGCAETMFDRNETMVVFNFHDPNIVVVQVSREAFGESNERTTIGYYFAPETSTSTGTGSGCIRTWNIYCSREQHNALCKLYSESNRMRQFTQVVQKKKLIKG